MELQVNDLTKSFNLSWTQRRQRGDGSRKLVAVSGLSLALHPGQIYGLLGPNGAGKTTALRCIATLIEPDSGTIEADGKDVHSDLAQYRRHVGFMTSELKLDDFFTPAYTMTYMGRLYGLSEEQIQARRAELFARFGIDRFADAKIASLSTGMKQKVSLAVSLCHDPDLIIFDEPTNGLDIVATRDVENYLVELRRQGKTILISTHIFSLVEKLCDRVGIILEGKLALEGELKELTIEANLETVFFDLLEGRR